MLVGLMGAGKSTVGRLLAERLGLAFLDADQEIERLTGYSVTRIFAELGEDHFRELEKDIIADLLDGPKAVIAVGGGAFIQDEVRRLILAKATAIWLHADIDTLVARLSGKSGRPLLDGRDAREVLTELAAERDPVYAQAPVHVRSGDEPAEETAQSVLSVLGRALVPCE